MSITIFNKSLFSAQVTIQPIVYFRPEPKAPLDLEQVEGCGKPPKWLFKRRRCVDDSGHSERRRIQDQGSKAKLKNIVPILILLKIAKEMMYLRYHENTDYRLVPMDI